MGAAGAVKLPRLLFIQITPHMLYDSTSGALSGAFAVRALMPRYSRLAH